MTKGYSSSYFVLDTDFSSTKTINVVFATSIFHAIKLPNFVCDRSSKINRHFWPLQQEFDIGIVFVAERVRENFVSKMKIDYCRWQQPNVPTLILVLLLDLVKFSIQVVPIRRATLSQSRPFVKIFQNFLAVLLTNKCSELLEKREMKF